VILQEVSDTGYRDGNVVLRLQERLNLLLAGDVAYSAVYARSNADPTGLTGFEEGNGLLSRFEILDVEVWQFRDQAVTVIPQQRRGLKVTLRGNEGDLDVVGLHLDGRVAAANVAELVDERLPARARPLPVVIAGDFNSPPESDAIRAMRAAGYVDVWQQANPGRDGPTSHHEPLTDPQSSATRRIDYVFVSPDVEVVRAALFMQRAVPIRAGEQTRWLWGSDHTGIFAVLRPGLWAGSAQKARRAEMHAMRLAARQRLRIIP
jgi:endonuclease/exonuclease/phosphatase family metal-dependent hydrolase